MATFEIILLLMVFSACRSTRQQSESIHMAQRQQQQLQCYDTLWQILNLKLDNLVVEWENDTARQQVKSVRLTASKAEAGLQHHAAAWVEVTTTREDTLAWENKETTPRLAAAPEEKRRRWWWLLLVAAVFGLGIGYLVIHYHPRT